MEKKSFTVKAEFSREDNSGWLSYEKSFASIGEAKAAYVEASANPNLVSVTLVSTTTLRPR